MKGSPEVIKVLNQQLVQELEASDCYLMQARMLGDWGYTKLADRIAHESEDEKRHADLLLQRILFLEGKSDMGTRKPLNVPKTPIEIMESNVADEIKVRDGLRAAIKVCLDHQDHTSRKILEVLLEETEHDHLLWFETQVRIAKTIGVERWLAEQI